jgi:two-component system LytT family sensor kinase
MKRHIRFLLLLGSFSLLALYFSTEAWLINYFDLSDDKVNYWFVLFKYSVRWVPWAVLIPLILFLDRRLKRRFSRPYFVIAFHLASSVVFSFLQIMLCNRISYLARDWLSQFNYSTQFPYTITNYIHFNILTYWVVIGAAYAFETYRKYREREVAAARLETKLAQANLQVLKMQIHPHFLFNTLHTIAALISRDQKAAHEMVTRLSDLLRATLDQSGRQEIPLQEELEILKKYLEIMKVRFGERLSIELDTSPDTLAALVPNFILQPLVENAIMHGILPRKEGGTIKIRTRTEDGRLVIRIADDGVGLKEGTDELEKKGFGLKSTRQRLEKFYGPEHAFELANREGGGSRLTLRIPLRSEFTQTG